MANSRFAYVRNAELDDRLLPSTFIVVRLDGKGFTKFSESHGFVKPNDRRALDLMNAAAQQVMASDLGRGSAAAGGGQRRSKKGKEKELPAPAAGIVLAFGESDEYSFCFGRGCGAYNRRGSKILTTVLSTFAAAYVHLWPSFFPESPLQVDNLPTFDGRIVQYSTIQEVRDYFRWRQVDTHINNLYNTTFWALVQQGHLSPREAHAALSGTVSADKHEILFSRFGINYNGLEEIFKKGSILIWESDGIVEVPSSALDEAKDPVSPAIPTPHTATAQPGAPQAPAFAPQARKRPAIIHEDLIKDDWWHKDKGRGLLGPDSEG